MFVSPEGFSLDVRAGAAGNAWSTQGRTAPFPNPDRSWRQPAGSAGSPKAGIIGFTPSQLLPVHRNLTTSRYPDFSLLSHTPWTKFYLKKQYFFYPKIDLCWRGGGDICLSVYLMGLSVLDYCHVSMKIPTSKLMWFQKWKGLSILGRH